MFTYISQRSSDREQRGTNLLSKCLQASMLMFHKHVCMLHFNILLMIVQPNADFIRSFP